MLVVGIAGGSGAGKTTVVNKITAQLPKDMVTLVPQDSYYWDSSHLPMEERKKINFDHPNAIEWELLIRHIKELKEGKSVEQPIYAYITSSRAQETLTVKPSNVIIVEGIMVLTQPELRDLMDVKVYVDADADDRLARILRRDTVERGRSVNDVLEHYYDTVKPMHLQFIEPTKRYADIIVPNIGDNDAAVNLLAKFIHQHIDNN
ncbi:MAG: uridine kinase [Bacteroidales bacterium]|jgi:uridine kinase|nr:uridine kinase [Bacteroidales bacterium]MBR4584947.1 uridine kinase [Bacteroidales bacterium]